jgi:hypothetical protein
MRRVHLRGHINILKRLLIHTGGFNLGLLMRQLIGVGTPRGLQGRLGAVVATLLVLTRSLWVLVTRHGQPVRHLSLIERRAIARSAVVLVGARETAFVAVGTTVTCRPPHRTVRAELLHTAPTLDGWRRSAHSDVDAGYGRWEASV